MTHAWHVSAMIRSEYMKSVSQIGTRDDDIQGLSREEIKKIAATSRHIGRQVEYGELVDPALIGPDWAFHDGNPKGDMAPNFMCFGGRYMAVNQASKDLLETFDLGQIQFFPITVQNAGLKQTAWPKDQVYIMNVGNKKEAVVVEQPHKYAFYERGKPRDAGLGRPIYSISGPAWVTVSAAALEGPDIWMDPRIVRGLFVSPRLAAGIKKAGLARGWVLTKTQTPELH